MGTENPSDLVSQGLDLKTSSTLQRLRFRFKSGGLPSVVSATSNINVEANNNNGWDAILWDGRLYIHVGPSQMTDGSSKEAFVSLLEYAEEYLGCTHVVVCIDKRQSNGATKMAIRNFLFLGFRKCSCYMYMIDWCYMIISILLHPYSRPHDYSNL